MSKIAEGYKQTEVGIIPSDWEAKKLGDGINLLSGHHVLAQYCNTKGDGFPYLTGPADFPSGTIQHSKFTVNPTTMCRSDDILVTVKGSGSGTIVLADAEYCISRQLMAVRVTNWDNRYIYHSLQKDESVFGAVSTGLIPGLSRSDILDKLIPLPPTKAEQTAIATALNDADALITQLEKLIAKKRNIKQGAMQELLKPKEGWEVKGFGEVIELQGGSQPPLTTFITSQKEGYIRLLQIRDYKTDKYETYIPLHLAKKFCAKNDIMIGRYGPPVFQILKGLEGAYNVALMKAVPSDRILEPYAYHFLKQNSLLLFVEKLSQRTAGQSGIDIQELNKYPFPVPPFKEQARIAQILSDMDAEIEALEKKLEKYKMIKQGMMQELLTGKTRLV